MLFRYLFTSVLALGFASAARAETRQADTTNIQLKNSALDIIRSLDNVPMTDERVLVQPPIAADIFTAECDGGCKPGFLCTWYDQNDKPDQVNRREHWLRLGAFVTITAVSCGYGVRGTVTFSNEEGDRYEHELVLDQMVVLPDNLPPVFYTHARARPVREPYLREGKLWGCNAFSRERDTFDDLGVFFVNERFKRSFKGGEIAAWKCALF